VVTTREIGDSDMNIEDIDKFPENTDHCYVFSTEQLGKTLKETPCSGMIYLGTEFTLKQFKKNYGDDERYKDAINRYEKHGITRIVVTKCGRVDLLTEGDVVYPPK